MIMKKYMKPACYIFKVETNNNILADSLTTTTTSASSSNPTLGKNNPFGDYDDDEENN
jgi:hypothetical protein